MTAKLNFRSALFLLLPALVLTTFGCKDMKLDIQDSKDRLDILEGTTITTINEQITAINSSIADLQSMDKTLDDYIKTLETTAADLQKQINDANAEIAKVESELGEEITSLEQSLLYELNAAKSAIEAEMSAINLTLAELKAADAALDKKIADLRTYVDTELASTKDWANATFSTLTQYEQTQTEISGIKASIEQINTDMAALETRLNGKIAADIKTAIDALRIELNTDHASRIDSAVNNLTVAYTAAVSSARSEITTAYTNAIANAIIESESGMKAWVNTKLTQCYYDIATIDGKLQALSARLDEVDEELQEQIDQQKSDLETAKSELTSAYKKAINDAIQTNNGVISAEIADAVQKLETKINSRLSTIESQITAMQKGIDEIIDDIDTIQKQIESINTTLGTLESEDQELNTLIDKLQSDYAALLQELEEIRPIDEISKKTIVDDIANINLLIRNIQNVLNEHYMEFINRIQSLIYVPEYQDRKVRIEEDTFQIDFLISPSNQAKVIHEAWTLDKDVIKAFLKITKIPDTRAIDSYNQLSVTSIVGNESGVLSVTIKIDDKNKIEKEFLAGIKNGVVNIQISDGVNDIFSEAIDISCVDFSVFKDLSPEVNGIYQTANSYIISKSGLYRFKAYRGNSQELAGTTSEPDIYPKGKIFGAKVVWESFGTYDVPVAGDLINYVKYVDGTVVFRTPDYFKEGNAVISVFDVEGTILWSWHLWFTDTPVEQEYYNNAGVMMDRNLGATSSSPSDGLETYGLLYQWGRKDPFLYSRAYPQKFVESTIWWPSSIETNTRIGTIMYSVSHPTQFLLVFNHHWYHGESINPKMLWTDSAANKSVYDPCPHGWRVPDGGPNGVWAMSTGADEELALKIDSVNQGFNFSGIMGDDEVIWYPEFGYKYWGSKFGENEHYPYNLTLYTESVIVSSDYYTRAEMGTKQAVRCVKESK